MKVGVAVECKEASAESCREKEKTLSKLPFPVSQDGEGRTVQPGTAAQGDKMEGCKKEVLAMATFERK